MFPAQPRRTGRPQRVGPGHVGRFRQRDAVALSRLALVDAAEPVLRLVVAPHDRLQIQDFRGSNFRRIDQRQRSVRGLKDLVVADDGGPLQGEPHVAPLALVETRVHSVLEIRGGRYLRFLFLFGKHAAQHGSALRHAGSVT